jgi:hypothetical protein
MPPEIQKWLQLLVCIYIIIKDRLSAVFQRAVEVYVEHFHGICPPLFQGINN